jgi:MFS family permease
MDNLFAVNDKSAFPPPGVVYNWQIYLLALSASMGSSMFGYDSAFIGGAITLPSFTASFGLGAATGTKLAALKANIASTFQAGSFFGAILCYPLTERLGRRISLVLCGLVFDIGALLQLVAGGHIGVIYAGRAMTGLYCCPIPISLHNSNFSLSRLAVGASSLMVPIYISECSPPAIRGRLVGVFEVVLQFSQIVGF